MSHDYLSLREREVYDRLEALVQRTGGHRMVGALRQAARELAALPTGESHDDPTVDRDAFGGHGEPTLTGDRETPRFMATLPPDVLARWSSCDRSEAIRQAEDLHATVRHLNKMVDELHERYSGTSSRLALIRILGSIATHLSVPVGDDVTGHGDEIVEAARDMAVACNAVQGVLRTRDYEVREDPAAVADDVDRALELVDRITHDGRRWMTVEADPETGEPWETAKQRTLYETTKLRAEHAEGELTEARRALEQQETDAALAIKAEADAAAGLAEEGEGLRRALAEAGTPEVVSGEDAAKLPARSVIGYVENGELRTVYWRWNARWFTPDVRGPVGGLRVGPHYRLLYRAPAPAPERPLQPGEVISDAAELDRRARVGTVVQCSFPTGDYLAQRDEDDSDGDSTWLVMGVTLPRVGEALDFPITVVRPGAST